VARADAYLRAKFQGQIGQTDRTGQDRQTDNGPDSVGRNVLQTVAQKTDMLIRSGSAIKYVVSLRLEESLLRKMFVKEVGFEVGVKERASYGWREWCVNRVRRCDRSR